MFGRKAGQGEKLEKRLIFPTSSTGKRQYSLLLASLSLSLHSFLQNRIAATSVYSESDPVLSSPPITIHAAVVWRRRRSTSVGSSSKDEEAAVPARLMARSDDGSPKDDAYHHQHHSHPRSASGGGGLAGGGTTSIHVTALDGLVNVNSLFTVAVFVGLSLASPGQRSLEGKSSCDAGDDVARSLLVFEVVSFSSFLFSSLVAQGLKLAINLLNSREPEDAIRARINSRVLRLGMLASAAGSVLGCLFLVISMVDVIQIRLGMLSCGSKAAVRSAAALITLVSTALVFYISTVFYAFTHWD